MGRLRTLNPGAPATAARLSTDLDLPAPPGGPDPAAAGEHTALPTALVQVMFALPAVARFPGLGRPWQRARTEPVGHTGATAVARDAEREGAGS